MADRSRTASFDWEDIRFFLALARSRSLSAASRFLRVNHATVARRVSALEQATGSVLFERRPDGYMLTAQGEALLGPAVSMEESARGLAEAVAGRTATGTVRLTTVRSLADVFLVDRLGDFRSRHPGIVLEVITDVRVLSLSRREAEVALRLGRPPDSGLVGRKVGEIRYGFSLSAHMPTDSAATVALLAYDRDAEGIVEAAWLARQFPDRPVSFHSNSNTAQAAAARAGFGVAMLP
ncbi:LysR family transcriptional regulator, partial [Nostoc sp. NIES-2111]